MTVIFPNGKDGTSGTAENTGTVSGNRAGKKVNDKNWILENYLNSINLGSNTLGVQAAAQRYFGKDVSKLTLSECAVIAGITKNPAGYNPILHPKENAKRRKNVLDAMKNRDIFRRNSMIKRWQMMCMAGFPNTMM